MKRKHVIRAMNLMRAIEANARISKVLLNELDDVLPKVEKAIKMNIYLEDLHFAASALVEEADAVHGFASMAAAEAGLEIPPDDADGVELVIQCCGGK